MQKQVELAEALKRKYPEQIAYAVARDSAGKTNPITLGWLMQTSHEPPMFAISVAPQRYSYEVIDGAGCFTLVFPTGADADQAMLFGTKSGRDCDKIEKSSTAVSQATVIDSVIFDDAVANFECVVEDKIQTGDHYIFVGRVVASHVNCESKGRLYTVATGWKMGSVKSEGE